MKTFQEIVERAFDRTETVLRAIEDGDPDKISAALNTMAMAQPWDLVAIGQGYVIEQLQNERDQDARATS